MYTKEYNQSYSRSLWGMWPLEKPKWQYLNPIERCFVVLCQSFHLEYEQEDLFEDMPAHKNALVFEDVRKLLAKAHCRTYEMQQSMKHVDERFFPLLAKTKDDQWLLLLKKQKDRFFVFDPNTCQYDWQDDLPSIKKLYFFKMMDPQEDGDQNDLLMSNLWQILKKRLPKLAILSLLVNTTIVTMPLYIIMVYDRVVNTKAYMTLLGLVVGMFIILTMDYVLRQWRSKMIVRYSSMLDMYLDRAILKKMARWPLQKIESLSIYQHYQRLKSYEHIRDVIVGPLFGLFIDIPFVILAFVIIALVGGWIALIPIAMTLIFIIVGSIKLVMSKAMFEKNQAGQQNIYDMLLSSLRNRDLIKRRQLSKRMQDLFAQLAAKQSLDIVKSQKYNTFIQHFGQFIMMSGGVITIAFGALGAMRGELSIGELIAIMTLIWKVITPLQTFFVTFPQIRVIKGMLHDLEQFLHSADEFMKQKNIYQLKDKKWNIELQRVSMRYTHNQDPVLLGIDLSMQAGQIIALAGPCGSGKSTLLKLVAALYPYQTGSIRVNEHDLRHLDLDVYRRQIGYLSQKSPMLQGTIKSILLESNPFASNLEMERVLVETGIYQKVQELPNGIETVISDTSKGLSRGFIRRLAIAQILLRNPKIILLDEPDQSLDSSEIHMIKQVLGKHFHDKIIIMVSHHPHMLSIAHRVILLNQGRIEKDLSTSEFLASFKRQDQNPKQAQDQVQDQNQKKNTGS
jgi:ATP-binding cassette subfamily C protein LapB